MKVGKNNFKPPPQVESSVVRLEIKNPRPQISYDEWDGLLRIVFVRKNKTIAAGFKSSAVMGMVEKNYRTWCATTGVPLDDGDVDIDMVAGGDDIADDEEMEIDENGMGVVKKVVIKRGSKKNRGKVADLVKSKVEKVLSETELGEKRAGKCDEADFLKLLYELNKEGIHFS